LQLGFSPEVRADSARSGWELGVISAVGNTTLCQILLRYRRKSAFINSSKIFDKKQVAFGHFRGDEDKFTLQVGNCPKVEVPHCPTSGLPIGEALCGPQVEPTVKISALDEENINLSSGKKLLLEWHYRFGHFNFAGVKHLLCHVPFVAQRFAAAVKDDAPKFNVCQLAKQSRRSRKSTLHPVVPERDGALNDGHMVPGARVSVGHFESRLLGRTFDFFGNSSSAKFKGGCIFVDNAASYVHVEHQVGFSAVETIRAKQGFERLCMENGVVVQDYLTDSGDFKANSFVAHINETHQKLRSCGTNAHHQNGVAERSIQTISNMARAMILHVSIHWKNGHLDGLKPSTIPLISTTTLPTMGGFLLTSSRDQQCRVIAFSIIMYGVVQCMYWIRKCKAGRSFHDQNPDPAVGCLWG
jgi:hypothetical protein